MESVGGFKVLRKNIGTRDSWRSNPVLGLSINSEEVL